MTTTTFTSAFTQARAERAVEARKERTPLLTKVARFAGRHAPRWERLRTTTLQLGSFGLIDFGLFEWNTVAGFIGSGISLMVFDYLSGDDRR